jgi:hypothetical protein
MCIQWTCQGATQTCQQQPTVRSLHSHMAATLRVKAYPLEPARRGKADVRPHQAHLAAAHATYQCLTKGFNKHTEMRQPITGCITVVAADPCHLISLHLRPLPHTCGVGLRAAALACLEHAKAVGNAASQHGHATKETAAACTSTPPRPS